MGANFSQTKVGVCPIAWLGSAFLFLVSGAIGLESLSQMIFGVLGMTPEDPNYLMRIVLIGFLAVVGGLVAIADRMAFRRVILTISALLEGLMLGFYWGGNILGRSLFNVCLVGGITAFIFLCGFLLLERKGFGVMVFTLGVAFANGMFFLSGVNALQALFVQQWLYGVGWSLIAVVYFVATIQTIAALYQQFKVTTATNFAGADLSQVRWQD